MAHCPRWAVCMDGVSLPSLFQAADLNHGFSVHSSHSLLPDVYVTFLCIPRDLGLPSRTWNVISGIRRRLRSFHCAVIISSLSILIQRLHVLCSLGSGVKHLPADVQEMCSPPHIMSVLCTLLSAECLCFDLDSGCVFVVRNPSCDFHTATPS